MKKISWVLLIILLCGLYWFSAQNGDASTRQSNEVLNRLNLNSKEHHLTYTVVVRKSAHILIYCVIGMLLYMITKSPFKTLVLVFLIACGDEWHQTFVPGRAGRLMDVGIDMLGGMLAVGLFKGVYPFNRYK